MKRLSLPDGSQWRLSTDGSGATVREPIPDLDLVEVLKLADVVDADPEPVLVPDNLLARFTAIPVAGSGPAQIGQLQGLVNTANVVNEHTDAAVAGIHIDPGTIEVPAPPALSDADKDDIAKRVVDSFNARLAG